MSSLYLKYLKEKKKNEDTYYLFKVGNFYIFIDEDAKKISEVVPLKLTNLTVAMHSEPEKCISLIGEQ